MMSKMLGIILIAISLMFTQPGCGLDGDSEDGDLTDLNNLKAVISQMIDGAPCSNSNDCRYIAFGSKPCGGPWSYLIYSASSVDTMLLKMRVQIFNERERVYNKKYGINSDCMFVSPPDSVTCSEGKCVAVY